MTEETEGERERVREKERKRAHFLRGKVSTRQALSLISLLLCGMRM